MSAQTQILPTATAVRTLLSQLVGREVTVKPVPAVPAAKGTQVVAVYVHDDGSLASVWVSTVECAAVAGAALTGIPAAQVDQQIDRDRLGDMVLDNFRELMNVGASLFNADGAAHVRLKTIVQAPHEPLPPGVADIMKTSKARLVMHQTVTGYGDGHSWIALAP